MQEGKKKKYNAGDEDQVKGQKVKAKMERDQQLEDIKALMALPAGPRFFRRILEEGRVFSTTFTGNSQTFFLEGHRNFALKIFNDVVEATPDKVAELMLKPKEETKENIDELFNDEYEAI